LLLFVLMPATWKNAPSKIAFFELPRPPEPEHQEPVKIAGVLKIAPMKIAPMGEAEKLLRGSKPPSRGVVGEAEKLLCGSKPPYVKIIPFSELPRPPEPRHVDKVVVLPLPLVEWRRKHPHPQHAAEVVPHV
jgi:hypothetical protein